MKNIHLEALYDKLHNILSKHFTGMLIENCVLRLNGEGHKEGVKLHPYAHTKNLVNTSVELFWQTSITDQIAATYKDENRITDHATMCLALLIAAQLTDFKYVEASKIGDGIDFWLSKTDEFDFFARLEVSGIHKTTKENSIKRRLKIKLTQTNQSDSTNIPVYICIIEFSKPQILYIKK